VTSPHRIPPNSASSAISLAANWLRNCLEHHPECHVEKEAWLPTRLIDVGLANSDANTKLVLSSDIPKDIDTLPAYLALSHRWGASTIFTLKTTNQDRLIQRIPMEQLSTTFQDAIYFTRRLNIRYLWIDSLCIAQDSLSDWETESALMGKVYKHSLCNIAASAAYDATGFYQHRDLQTINSILTVRMRIRRKNHEGVYFLSLGNNTFSSVPPGPLHRRGWVFQERMLSPRSLHFSTQLFWECRTLRACETYPQKMPQEVNFWSFNTKAKSWGKELRSDNAVRYWQDLLGTYIDCELTYPTDRLVAFSGIAQEFQPVLRDKYLAGMWWNQLPESLAWSIAPHNLYERAPDPWPTRPVTYRCKCGYLL
jgi:hypothetical protein